MTQFFQYYGRFTGFKGRLISMPFWARAILVLFALPGMILLLLSFVALGISIFALLLLTVPAYRLLSALTSRGASANESPSQPQYDATPADPTRRRHVDVRIIDEPPPATTASSEPKPLDGPQ
jgi:hypothetical protein